MEPEGMDDLREAYNDAVEAISRMVPIVARMVGIDEEKETISITLSGGRVALYLHATPRICGCGRSWEGDPLTLALDHLDIAIAAAGGIDNA